MVSNGVLVGALFILGMFVLGVVQSQVSHVALVEAAPDAPQISQQELNICMNDCMRACVTIEGTEGPCLDGCNAKCGGP